MSKVVEFLKENPVQYLATVGRDGKAKCRPFMFIGEMEGKLWFCTNNTKDVYKDMLANPEIEISTSSPSYAWIRLNGKAVFENNMAAKEMCMGNPIVKGQYQTADNPIFEVFYLNNAHGVIAVGYCAGRQSVSLRTQYDSQLFHCQKPRVFYTDGLVV